MKKLKHTRLSIEDRALEKIMDGYEGNPITMSLYARMKRKLLKYTYFSFRNRSDFTQHQKSVITRFWSKYRRFIKSASVGNSIYILKSTRKQRRDLSKRYVTSNKAVILESVMPAFIPTPQQACRILNKLMKRASKINKKMVMDDILSSSLMRADCFSEEHGDIYSRSILVQEGKYFTIVFFPLKFDSTGFTEKLDDLINLVMVRIRPNSLSLGVGKSQSQVPYTPDEWEYYEELWVDLNAKIEDTDPFNGVHAMIMKD